MKTSPLTPSASLLIKLGSIIVHAEEYLSSNGHDFDRQTFETLNKDKEVIEWKKQMDKLALLPKKRNP